MWLTHRTELAEQTRDMLRQSASVSAWHVSRPSQAPMPARNKTAVILMAQTAGKRARSPHVWDHYGADDLMIIDEAHHAAASGYERAMQRWPGRVLGMTATPWRLSITEGFDHLFDGLVCGPQSADLQTGGFLCDTRVMIPDPENRIVGGELGSIGEYTESGIERANAGHPDIMTAGALESWKEKARGRQTIVYAVSVRHARNLVAVFNQAGIPSELMLGDTPLEERAATIERFRDGRLAVLVNVAVATEGFDLPDASCVMITRPTQSLSLYLQMVGRGMRPKPDGGDCIILDLAGNSLIHGLPEDTRQWSLEPRGAPSDGEAPVALCEICYTASAAASHNCQYCGNPFGTGCSRCGKWRAWRRWSLDYQCKYTHDKVCDFCHRDAHLEAHLPVTDEMRRLADEADDEDDEDDAQMTDEYSDLEAQLAQLIRAMLSAERSRAAAQLDARHAELSAFISEEGDDLKDDAVLEEQFSDYLNTLPPKRRPSNRIQESRMIADWIEDRENQLEARGKELYRLQREPVNETEIFNRVQNRLAQILQKESRTVSLNPADNERPLLPEIPNTGDSKLSGRPRGRRRRGKSLPQRRYSCPILLTLLRMGGEGRVRDVVDQVGEIVQDELTPEDLAPTSSRGELKWRNMVQWERNRLKNQGFLDPNSPYGIWRLTAAGRERAERCAQGLE